jgi:hypothetical protein
MSESERETQAKSAWRIEVYHRALKQQCLIERAQCRRLRPVLNHIGLCIKAFVRIESHCYREKISWIEAKTSIIRMPSEPIYRIRVIGFSQLRKS